MNDTTTGRETFDSELGPVTHVDETVDVLVVGSGAGGLSAAVTAAYHGLQVQVAEKAERCGGATGWSGGWMWTPGNPFARADGVVEGPDDGPDGDHGDGPRTYLKHRLGPNFDAPKVDAFLAAAPDMVGFFEVRTRLHLTPGTWISDIHGDTPGAGTGHRSVAPLPVGKRSLSPRVRRLLPKQLYETSFLGMGIMAGPDLRGFLAAAQLDPADCSTRRSGPPGISRSSRSSVRASASSTAPRSCPGCCSRLTTRASPSTAHGREVLADRRQRTGSRCGPRGTRRHSRRRVPPRRRPRRRRVSRRHGQADGGVPSRHRDRPPHPRAPHGHR